MDSLIKTQKNGAVFEITLNRPERLNALTMDLFTELNTALDAAAAEDISCVVFRGEGKVFCVGGDIKVFADVANSGQKIPEAAPDLLHEAIIKMRSLAKPILTLVHGACAGAGISLALASDLVMAAAETKFNLAYVGIGLSPDGGSTYFLPRHLGAKKAMEIFLTGMTFSAQEALDMGLINRVVDPGDLFEQGQAMAQMLAMGPTVAFARLKKMINQTFDNTLGEQLKLESQCFSECSATEDFKSGVNAFLAKQPPVFQGR